MAIERRLTEIAGAGRGQAPHRALAQRPGGHRRRDVRARAHAHDVRPGHGPDARAGRPRRPPHRLADARLHAPPARAARLSRPPPARPLLAARARRRSGSSSASRATDRLPLGAGALAGVNFDTDREWVARELGFEGVVENSMDAVSNRDFVLDFIAAAATCATHLSQLGAEIVLWSSEEFGFCEVADAFASGSSIMPQKKNPDAAELLRAKAPRIVGRLVGAPRRAPRPAAHLQQGPPGGQGGAVRRRRHARAVPDGGERDARRASTSTASGSRAAASDEMLAATDVADLLVKQGVPFREAHGIVAGLVRRAVDDGRDLSELRDDELAELAPALRDPADFRKVLSNGEWLESKRSRGGHVARPGARAARARPRAGCLTRASTRSTRARCTRSRATSSAASCATTGRPGGSSRSRATTRRSPPATRTPG